MRSTVRAQMLMVWPSTSTCDRRLCRKRTALEPGTCSQCVWLCVALCLVVGAGVGWRGRRGCGGRGRLCAVCEREEYGDGHAERAILHLLRVSSLALLSPYFSTRMLYAGVSCPVGLRCLRWLALASWGCSLCCIRCVCLVGLDGLWAWADSGRVTERVVLGPDRVG